MARVQQLVDGITNMQADLCNVREVMSEKNATYATTIDALLEAKGMAGVEDVINAAMSQMTADERKVFEAVSLSSSRSQRCSGTGQT